MVAASSIHLHRLAVLAQDVTSTDSSKFPSSNHLQNRNSFQPNVNGGSMIQTTGAQLPVNPINHNILLCLKCYTNNFIIKSNLLLYLLVPGAKYSTS